MKQDNWITTQERFVAFFDIMGFKELVERQTHDIVLEKLKKLKEALGSLDLLNDNVNFFDSYKLNKAITKSVTFSDSIIIFSNGNSKEDACKIITDAGLLLLDSIENSIAIKGAISFGTTTVDIENSLYFGRPIIDAYLLHDQLQQYSIVLDYNAEAKINALNLPQAFQKTLHDYKANMKSGKITHKLVNSYSPETIKKQIESIRNMYNTVSGSPRIYIDNTLDFIYSLQKK